MRKLISEILNSENVIEKCCELEILNRNWKLLLFDSGVDNLVLYEFNKKFGKYEICGMGDYNHCFIINRDMLIKQENVPLAFSTCVNFDSNVSSYISSMFFKNRQDNDLVNMIQYIRSKNFQTTCQHYAFEVSLNLYPVKEDAIYNTLYADSMLAEMSDEQIEKRDFTPFVLPENAYQKIYKGLQYIKNDKGKDYELFDSIYAMLLKAFIIKSGGKKENRKKIEDFLDFVINNVGCYLENEVYLIGKYLCNSGDTVFFRHMQQNRDKDNFFRDVRGMAWDLCHLRNVLEEMKVRNTSDDITFLHCFASYETGLVDILKSNRIKRILYLDGQAYYKYEHDVFEIDGCMELKKTYKESFEKKVKNSMMKELCFSLEQEAGHFLKG